MLLQPTRRKDPSHRMDGSQKLGSGFGALCYQIMGLGMASNILGLVILIGICLHEICFGLKKGLFVL